MKHIVDYTVTPGHPLLITGLPLARGVLHARDQLLLHSLPDRRPIRLWWEIRSWWPDGSARWIFLHAGLLPGQLLYRLSCAAQSEADGLTGAADPTASGELQPMTAADAPIAPLVMPDAEGFRVTVNGLLRLRVQQEIDCDLPASGTPFHASILENSPVAPLYRIANSGVGRLRTVFLLRIDPGCTACRLTARYSNVAGASAQVRSIRLKIDVHVPAQTSPSRNRQESGVVAVPVAVPDAPVNTTGPDDLLLRTAHVDMVVAGGKRRGPVSLHASDRSADASDLVIAGDGLALPLGSGISLRHDFHLLPRGSTRFAAISLPDGYVSGTGVFGPMPDLTAGSECPVAPGLAAGLDHLLKSALAVAGQAVQEPGILHDGDWLLAPGQYGANGYQAYADNEYDMPHVCWLAYAASNEPAYKDLAIRCGVHMADMDCRCTDGDMLYHGYNETAEDHAEHRVLQGDPGHSWTDGLWSAWFWTGDPFAREAALALTLRLVRYFDSVALADEFAICERNIGWPLLVAVSAMETGLAGRETVEFCCRVIAFLDAYTADPNASYMDPDGPVWWRCAMQDGSKPFMLGVLGEALDRYGALSGDPRGGIILRRIALFIMKIYDPVRADFAYEYNAYGPNHRQVPAQHLIPLFARTLLAGLWAGTLNGPCEQAIAAIQASAWTLFDCLSGKEMALMARGLFSSLAILNIIGQAARQQSDDAAVPSDGSDCCGWTGWSGETGAVDRFEPAAYADRGCMTILFSPDGKSPDRLNRQGLLHVCAQEPNKSAVSIITFYDRIQVRFYDADSNLINSLDAFLEPDFFSAGTQHKIRVYYAAPGEARLEINDKVSAETRLSRPLSGSFRIICTGCRPGNWKAYGQVHAKADFARCAGMR